MVILEFLKEELHKNSFHRILWDHALDEENGFIKLKNFSQSNNKTRYLYVLTPKGAKEKKVLTTEFLKRKQLEYEKLYNYFN